MPKPLTETMRLLQGGAFNELTGDMLANIIKGVEETGKAGKLTITLDIKKVGAAVSVLAKATDKTPEKQPDADLYYATVEGNLSIDNPNQRKLDLQPVSSNSRDMRSAG